MNKFFGCCRRDLFGMDFIPFMVWHAVPNDDFSGVIYGIVKDHNNYDVMCVFFIISVQVAHTIFSYGMSANKGLILRFGGVSIYDM